MALGRSSLFELALAAVLAGPATAEVIIALNGPLTGSSAIFGDQMRRGGEYAVKRLNDNGGVLGQPVRLIFGDDACDPQQAVAVANKAAKARAGWRRRGDRPLLLGLVDPGLGCLPRERRAPDLAGLHQPEAHRRGRRQ